MTNVDRTDAYITAALCLSGFLVASWYLPTFRAGGGVPRFYQDQFAPAVMLACGRGFVNVALDTAPALDDFLQQRTQALRCADLPPAARPMPLTAFQGSSRYLMIASALVWRARGIDFHALGILIAALFAVAVAAAYAAVRLGCGRTAALAVALLWMFSYRHLENVPHLRDYSKAPFFVLTLVAMGIAAIEYRPRQLIALGALFGAVQGLGFGMRTDVALNFVPFLVVLFAARFDGLRALVPKVACAAAAVAVFVVVALPILQSYARGSSLWHVVLLGFTAPYDENLNIGFPRPAYSFPYAHNDSYIEAVVRADANRRHPANPPLQLLTRPYDRACQEYFVRLAQNFPGDLLTRGVASIAGIVNLPFWLPDGYVPVGVSNPFLKNSWRRRGQIAESMYGAGLPLAAAVLIVIGLHAVGYACAAFFLLLFWGAFPAIEFNGRHIFQFELVVLAAIAWAGTLLWRFVTSPQRAGAGARLLRSTAAVGVMFAIVAATVAGARAYQIPNVRRFVASYENAVATPVSATSVAPPAGQADKHHMNRIRLAVDLFHPPTAREEVEEVMLKAEFDFARCGHPPAIAPAFTYDVTDPWYSAFSRETPLEDLGAPPTRVFLPVYSLVHDWVVVARFAGVEVPSSFAPCVRLSRVDDTRALPLLLPLTVAPDWPRKLYQRVRLGTGLGY